MNKYTIVMGEYPQNNGSKKEPIEWIVLKKEEKRCLCISRYLLDCKPYHDRLENVMWQDCALRKWLNSEFLETAFSDKEQEKILLSRVVNPAQNTQDYIFLLSYDEVEKYFDDEVEDYVGYEERGALTTSYARKRGAWFLEEECEEKNRGCWWLRYYGKEYEKNEGKYNYISCVNFDGYIEHAAEDVTGVDCCVRPAFWLKTE